MLISLECRYIRQLKFFQIEGRKLGKNKEHGKKQIEKLRKHMKWCRKNWSIKNKRWKKWKSEIGSDWIVKSY